jgi:23S rRNA (adenine1618-N6)-methyltransferase
MKEAEAANKKKLSKLKHQKVEQAQFNFAGQSKELFYSGGEKKFIKSMIKESLKFKHDILYFSTLVSRDAHIKIYRDMLIQLKVPDVRTLDMQQGQKKSRILVWSFLTDNQKVGWAKMHWQNKNK